jgi:hypothetical protein
MSLLPTPGLIADSWRRKKIHLATKLAGLYLRGPKELGTGY